MLVFEERGNPEYPEKNLSLQSREPTISTHIGRRVWKSNLGHTWGATALATTPSLHLTMLVTTTTIMKRMSYHSYRWFLTRAVLFLEVTVLFDDQLHSKATEVDLNTEKDFVLKLERKECK